MLTLCVCARTLCILTERMNLCGDSFNRRSNKVLFYSLLLLFVVLSSCEACRPNENKISIRKKKSFHMTELRRCACFSWLDTPTASERGKWFLGATRISTIKCRNIDYYHTHNNMVHNYQLYNYFEMGKWKAKRWRSPRTKTIPSWLQVWWSQP